jgi:protein SCO1/2
VPGQFVDDLGQPRTLAQFAGKPTIVAMEYTECRFVCTINWRRLAELQDEADKQHLPVQFVIISLDPAHDSPALWREYRQMRGLKRENWRFLTGNRAATDAVVRWLGVKWWLFDGAIMHDFRISRLDAQGQLARVMDSFDQPLPAFLRD